MYMSYYKAQQIAKIFFSSLQGMREEASFCMFFEKFRALKRKLEMDDPKPPKKGNVLSHYKNPFESSERSSEFVSTFE